MESSYAETLKGLLANTPDSVQVPPALQALSRSQATPNAPGNHRRFARRKITGDMFCKVSNPLPKFSRTENFFKVASLDISRCGVSFLANKELYPEEALLLWTLIGRIPCRVVRCVKHNDACFEVGAEVAIDSGSASINGVAP